MRNRSLGMALLGALVLAGFAVGSSDPALATASDGNCPTGFHLDLNSGVSCVQDYETLPENGGLSYTGASICPLPDDIATYEQRSTSDGLPAPGTGGQTAFLFLVSCDPDYEAPAGKVLAELEGGKPGEALLIDESDPRLDATGSGNEDTSEPGGADPTVEDATTGEATAGEATTDEADDGASSGSGLDRRILIGVGGGAIGIVVTVATAQVLMKRFGMTMKQLVGLDLGAPGTTSAEGGSDDETTYGPRGATDYEEMVGPDGTIVGRGGRVVDGTRPPAGGRIRDVLTGDWIDYEIDDEGRPVVTGSGHIDVGSTSGKLPTYSLDDEPEPPEPIPDEETPELDEKPAALPVDLELPVVEEVQLHSMPEGFSLIPDPTTGKPALVWSTGQPDDPLHVAVRHDRRNFGAEIGLRPNDKLFMAFTRDSGTSTSQMQWTPNWRDQVTVTYQTGDGERRSFLVFTRRR